MGLRPEWFSYMTGEIAEIFAELDRIASHVSTPKDTVLFRCGERVSGIFIIYSGTVLMSLDGADDVFPPRRLGPGEIVGLPATLTGNYSLSAQTTEDAELGFIAAPRVNDLFECSPRLCLLAMRVIGAEIAKTRAALRDCLPHLPHDQDLTAPDVV